MSEQAFSIRKVIYCEILGKQCIEDNKLYLPGDIIVVKCSCCEACKSQVNSMEQIVESNIKIGDRVRTTEHFKQYSFPGGVQGIVKSLDYGYVNIVTDNEMNLSIRESSVQKVEE